MRRVFHTHFISRASVFLLAIGLLQMTGDLLRIPQLKGLAAATAASPAPKVFSSVQGLETFSVRFLHRVQRSDGTADSIKLTPEMYSRIHGPYNRRNVFGAALSYAPVLSEILAPGPCMTRSFATLFADQPLFFVKWESMPRISPNPPSFASCPVPVLASATQRFELLQLANEKRLELARHYSVVPLPFGAYLAIHYFRLVPWGPELFSNKGLLPTPST